MASYYLFTQLIAMKGHLQEEGGGKGVNIPSQLILYVGNSQDYA